MATANAPGASASAVSAPQLWNSLHDFLHGDAELHASFQASISSSPSGPFFTSSLAEFRQHLPDVQSVSPAALSSIALVKRNTKSPRVSPKLGVHLG